MQEIMDSRGSEIRVFFKIFAGLVFIGMTLQFFLPSVVNNILKPLAILLMLLFAHREQMQFKFKLRHMFVTLLIIWYAVALFPGHETGIIEFVNMFLYGMLFILLTSVELRKNEARLILKTLYFCAIFFSIMVIISNPLIGNLSVRQTNAKLLFIQINVNQIPYVILPGFAVEIQNFYYGIRKRRLLQGVCLILMIYAIIYPISRGAFVSLIAIFLLSIFSILANQLRRMKVLSVLALIIGVVIGGVCVFNALPKVVKDRLLAPESYMDSSGRLDMYTEAIELVDNPIVGEGAGYWGASDETKIHNKFINIYVSTGLIGLGLFCCFLFGELFSSRNSLLYAIVASALIQAMLESGDSYTFWVPVTVVAVLNAYRRRTGEPIQALYQKE